LNVLTRISVKICIKKGKFHALDKVRGKGKSKAIPLQGSWCMRFLDFHTIGAWRW